MATLLERVAAEEKDLIRLLDMIVRYESPSTEKSSVDRLGTFLAGEMRQHGLRPELIPRDHVGDMLWTEWEGDSTEGRTLLLTHIDTVWAEGTLARNPCRVEEGRMYGPGIYDMKAGVLATLMIQRCLGRGWLRPRRNIRFLYTTDEETGSAKSRQIIEDFARECDLVLVPEPPMADGGIKTFRKGVAEFRLRIHGRSAHAGLDPQKGISAVEELAHQILAIHALADLGRGTTVNVTVVQGGTRTNVIPDAAQAQIDVRYKEPREGDRIVEAMQGLAPHNPQAGLEVEGGINRPPMVQTPRTREFVQESQKLARELGFELSEGSSGGGSDGSFCAALGIPTLDGLGVDGDGAHALHEHIRLDRLVPKVTLLARLAEAL